MANEAGGGGKGGRRSVLLFMSIAALSVIGVAAALAVAAKKKKWVRGGRGGSGEEEDEDVVLNMDEKEVEEYIHDAVRERSFRKCVPVVQRTWASLKPHRLEPCCKTMYSLFRERDPDAAALFSERLNWEEQQHAFSVMMGTLISVADSPQTIGGMLKSLGERHHRYGVRPTYFNSMLASLLEALSVSLGDVTFGDTEREAWSHFFKTVSSCLQLAGDGIYVQER